MELFLHYLIWKANKNEEKVFFFFYQLENICHQDTSKIFNQINEE